MCPFSLKLSTTSSWSQISFSHLFRRCIHTYPNTNDLSVILMVGIFMFIGYVYDKYMYRLQSLVNTKWKRFDSYLLIWNRINAFQHSQENYNSLKLNILESLSICKLLCKKIVIFKCVSFEMGSHFSYKAGFAWMLFKQLTFLSVFCCLFL